MVGLRGPVLVIDENVNLKTRCLSERIKSEHMSERQHADACWLDPTCAPEWRCRHGGRLSCPQWLESGQRPGPCAGLPGIRVTNRDGIADYRENHKREYWKHQDEFAREDRKRREEAARERWKREQDWLREEQEHALEWERDYSHGDEAFPTYEPYVPYSVPLAYPPKGITITPDGISVWVSL